MGNRSTEVGIGVVTIRPRPYVNEAAQSVPQLWSTRRLSPHLKISAIAAFDTDAVVAGGALAWLPIRASWLTAGVEGELGYAWLALALPVAIEMPGELVTLYTAPRLGTWGDALTPAIPLGVSVNVIHGLALRAEAQVSWADSQYYNRRWQLALAVAYQFGTASR